MRLILNEGRKDDDMMIINRDVSYNDLMKDMKDNRNESSTSFASRLISLLDNNEIDTTNASYELSFYWADDVHNEVTHYTITFNCPGDFLAAYAIPMLADRDYDSINIVSPTTLQNYATITDIKAMISKTSIPNKVARIGVTTYCYNGPVEKLVNLNSGKVLFKASGSDADLAHEIKRGIRGDVTLVDVDGELLELDYNEVNFTDTKNYWTKQSRNESLQKQKIQNAKRVR